MSNRAPKHGFAHEAQKKIQDKWEQDRAVIALQWISQRIDEPLPATSTMEEVHELLKDGIVLCKLANWVKPGAVPASKLAKKPTMAFKQMELIGLFIASIDEANNGPVKKTELFQTVDLYESCNMVQVILTIEALGRAMQTAGREGFGKAESKGEHREFSEEQLKAGQNVIGLQMGSNKGASQSGQNFGKTRAIMD